MPTWPKGHLKQAADVVDQCRHLAEFDTSLEAEIQTDKEAVKALPCQHCKRPLIVSTFYVLAWAKCSPCKGVEPGSREAGSLDVVQAGRTDPALAKDLTKVLINSTFAVAVCPAHPDHGEMELKYVGHNDRYGPYVLKGYKDGTSIYEVIAPGETVMFQCNTCLCITSHTTTAVTKMRRCNEPGPRDVKHSNNWASDLGIRPYNPPEDGMDEDVA